ncbi:pancreatic lipase-related protein 2-like [Bombus affinis]|uniref:pancreatic lipase-related protein 2-like n=1 Tax=Bombus affinis TaxID=309941 RepID=UPI0021B829E5|nr:pancreatic lipase-related protein 2-like [Bombus affinis]
MLNASLSLIYPTLLSTLTGANSTALENAEGNLPLFNQDNSLLSDLEQNIPHLFLETIIFTLYTRKNPEIGEVLVLNDISSVQMSQWNPKRKTAIITHGWINNGLSPACTLIRDALIKVTNWNVIVVDWSKIAGNLIYPIVADHIPRVATKVASFVNFMRTEAGLRTSKLRIIGHSFGAQIAGLSAREVGKSSRVAEVIALDPAKPLFELKEAGDRVDKSDAQNVQVIHTCAGTLGMGISIGTSDFYANDGRHQPGCGLNLLGICAHLRSYELYAESITNPKGFLGTRADGETAYMGGVTLDPKANGTYYFKTTGQHPFALGG